MRRFLVSLAICASTIPLVACGFEGGDTLATRGGYNADYFGEWTDLDGDGCDTREEILERDAENPKDNDGDGCLDDAAVIDRYTRLAIPVNVTDIDHIVSKKEAWDSGASAWTRERRSQFFNDEGNLFSTHRSINRSKGDSDAAQWRVTVTQYGPDVRCEYTQRYRDIKLSYGLTITVTQDDALREICPVGGVRNQR